MKLFEYYIYVYITCQIFDNFEHVFLEPSYDQGIGAM